MLGTRVIDWEAKLDEFALLGKGWDSYDGLPITLQAISSVKLIIPILWSLGISTPYFIPMSSGGIALEWHNGDNELSLEIGPLGEIDNFFLYGNHLTTFELTRRI